MGKRENRVRDKRFELYLSDMEMQILKQKAAYCRLTPSAYFRILVTDGVIIKIDIQGIKDVCNEMNKIGSNINQVARHVNEKGGDYDKRDIKILQNQFNELHSLVMRKMIGMDLQNR